MTGWRSRWFWCGLPEKRTTCRPFGFSRVQDGFWVRWLCHVSLRKKRDSQARYFARLVLIWPRLETNWTHYWSYLVLLLISPATDSNGGKDKSMQWCWPSHQETNKKTIDKENTKIPNLVSSKETKPLNYEHRTRIGEQALQVTQTRICFVDNFKECKVWLTQSTKRHNLQEIQWT